MEKKEVGKTEDMPKSSELKEIEIAIAQAISSDFKNMQDEIAGKNGSGGTAGPRIIGNFTMIG